MTFQPEILDQRLNELVEANKAKGVVTDTEVMTQLMDVEMDPDQLESVLEKLESMGVRVVAETDTPAEPAAEAKQPAAPKPAAAPAVEEVNMSDPIRMYLKEIGKISLLTGEEEVALAKRIEAGTKAAEELRKYKDGESPLAEQISKARAAHDRLKDPEIEPTLSQEEKDELRAVVEVGQAAQAQLKQYQALVMDGQTAKDELIQANLRLVVSIAGHYNGRGMLYLDLIQEGNLGLIKAADKFDYSKGFKFSTYATWWIRQSITRSIADQARTIRIPVHMVETINRLVRTERQMLQELGREPTPEELAERLNTPVSRVRDIIQISQEPVSFETPIGEEEDSHLGDFIQDDNSQVPVDAAAERLLHEQLMNVIGQLSDREQKVLLYRFGLLDGKPRTLEEVGRMFNVTRERIRQIEAKALRKLRHPSRSRQLKDYLE